MTLACDAGCRVDRQGNRSHGGACGGCIVAQNSCNCLSPKLLENWTKTGPNMKCSSRRFGSVCRIRQCRRLITLAQQNGTKALWTRTRGAVGKFRRPHEGMAQHELGASSTVASHSPRQRQRPVRIEDEAFAPVLAIYLSANNDGTFVHQIVPFVNEAYGALCPAR